MCSAVVCARLCLCSLVQLGIPGIGRPVPIPLEASDLEYIAAQRKKKEEIYEAMTKLNEADFA
jgi:hypothetical protein